MKSSSYASEFNLTSTTQGYLHAFDFDTLVRLYCHRNLAFKGDNGKYLRAFTWGNKNYLQFSSDIPNDSLSRYEASVMLEGHIQLTSVHSRSQWNLSEDGWIFRNANSITSLHDPNTHFWPIKINANTITLRAADGKFCQRRVTNNLANGSIGTEQSSPTKEAELQVLLIVTLHFRLRILLTHFIHILLLETKGIVYLIILLLFCYFQFLRYIYT